MCGRSNESDPQARTIDAGAGQTAAGLKQDFTAIVAVDGLQPDTSYRYDVLIDGQSVLEQPHPTFRTYPRRGQAVQIKIGFGGGAGYTPQHERIWDTIARRELSAFFLLGDNVYIDLPEMPGPLHRYTYYRRQSRPEFRRLTQSTPIYAIWDDHDCGIDDVWMGPYVDRPSLEAADVGSFPRELGQSWLRE